MINYNPNFNFRSVIANPVAPIATPCMDQICGWIDADGHYKSIRHQKEKFNVDYFANGKAVCQGKTIKSPIAIILESPHVDEFYSCGIAKGPAQGRTGDRFDDHFEELLHRSSVSHIISTTSHAVVFVNSVQYQCSLGKQPLIGKNRKACNDNWRLCFNAGCNIDLVARLNALNPIAVINLCTAALKLDVEQTVCHFNNYTSGNHPASWCWSRYRKIK